MVAMADWRRLGLDPTMDGEWLSLVEAERTLQQRSPGLDPTMDGKCAVVVQVERWRTFPGPLMGGHRPRNLYVAWRRSDPLGAPLVKGVWASLYLLALVRAQNAKRLLKPRLLLLR